MIWLATFYTFYIVNKSHEKAKNKYVLVYLSKLPDSPTLSVALSPKR